MDTYGSFYEAWAAFFENHPEVLASWGHQNGRAPNCPCPKCDPETRRPRSNIFAD